MFRDLFGFGYLRRHHIQVVSFFMPIKICDSNTNCIPPLYLSSHYVCHLSCQICLPKHHVYLLTQHVCPLPHRLYLFRHLIYLLSLHVCPLAHLLYSLLHHVYPLACQVCLLPHPLYHLLHHVYLLGHQSYVTVSANSPQKPPSSVLNEYFIVIFV